MPRRPIHIAIHDDFPVVIAGLEQMLLPHAREVLVVQQSIGAPADQPVDLVLLDTFGQPFDFVDRVQAILTDRNVRRIAVYTWVFEPHLIEVARGVGVSGYLSKTTPADQLVADLVRIAGGEGVIHDPPVGSRRRHDDRTDWPGRELGLTERQAEVLVLAARGLTTAQIALRLRISVNTVKSHLRLAYEATGVRSRAEAANFVRAHLLDSDLPTIRSPWLGWVGDAGEQTTAS